jgi:choline dehydrogenase-like flavoprotein
MIVLAAFGLTPPGARLEMPPTGDSYVSLPMSEPLERYHAETERLLQSILVRNGCRLVETEFLDKDLAPEPGVHFSTAHQVGSCRMADQASDGVVDGSGEVFGYPGLYVSDGAAIPSSLSVNTSLTILANAERIAAGLLERYHLQAA